MVKLNRAVVLSVVFSLTISLLFSSCKIDQAEESPSSNEIEETENSETSSSDTEQTNSTDSSYATSEINYPYDLSVRIVSSSQDGDCVILNYKKTTQILIDTSEGYESIEEVSKVLEEMDAAKDKIWEYVIFTHSDSDHISYAPELFDAFKEHGCKVEQIIDFGDERVEEQESVHEGGVLSDYINALKELIKRDGCKYYSPNGDSDISDRKTREFVIDSRFKLTILYNDAYKKGDDNDQSVCCLFQIGDQKLLFTGDLEKNGEKALLNDHRELLRNVTFFKAGHHGSASSNIPEFVDWIRPAYVTITFSNKIPEKAVVDNIGKFLKYTDYIYPTVVKNGVEGVNPLFGNCTFKFNGKNVEVTNERNDNCTIKQAIINETMTNWYWKHVSDSMISDEVNTYFFDENVFLHSNGELEVMERAGNLSYYNCTLVKYGHYDILIDCGSADLDSKVLIEKLKDYVVDGVIECVIVSHFHLSNYSQLIGESLSDNESVFEQFKIEKIIDNDSSMTNNNNSAGTAYAVYLSKVLSISDHISMKGDDPTQLSLCDSLKLTVYRGSNSKYQQNEDDFSLVTVIDFNSNQMVFVGDLTNFSWFNSEYGNKLKKVSLLRFPSSYVEYSKMDGLDSFLSKAKPDVIVLGSPVNHWNNGQYFIRSNSINKFITFIENSSRNRNVKIYSPGYVDDNVNKSVFGDIAFTLFRSDRIIGDTTYKYYVSCCINGGSGKSISRDVKDKLNTDYYKFVPDDLRDFPAMS